MPYGNKKIKNPTAPATDKQVGFFKKLTGKVIDPTVTTKQEASDMITQAMAGGASTPASTPKATPTKTVPPKPKVQLKTKPKFTLDPSAVKPPAMDPIHKPFEDLIPKVTDQGVGDFVARQPYWDQVVNAHKAKRFLLLSGEGGTGKSTIPKVLGYCYTLPVLELSFDTKLNSRELFGQMGASNGATFFTEGLLTRMSQVPSILSLQEVSSMDRGGGLVWHQILQDRKFFLSQANDGRGKMYRLHKECYIMMDGNPPTARYNGTTKYNCAFVDRPEVINMKPWKRDELMELLKKWPQADKLADFYLSIQQQIRQDGYRALLSIRGLRRIIELLEEGNSESDALHNAFLNHVELTGGEDAYKQLKTVTKNFFKV